MWTGDPSGVFCSQPKRGALRRQACIDQHTQEQLQDPWVRLSDGSPKELPEIHRHHTADTQPINIHSQPATMSDEENTLALNSTATAVNSDPSSDMTPENTSETPPGVKTAPPVAPKPVWFRQSLRKIWVEQDQKKQTRPAEQRHTGGSSRSFKVRDASHTANLSIKQKIHSFETFSSPEGPEKRGNRRPLAPSTSLPPTEKESRSHPASHDCRKGKHEIPDEIQAHQSASVRDTDNISAITSSTSEAYRQTTAKSSEDEPPSIQSSTHLPLSDTISTDLDSGIQDFHSAPVHDDRNAFPLKPELERVTLTRSTEDKALPPETSVTSNQAEGEGPPEGTEEGGEQSPGKLLSMTPPTDSNPLRGLEGESLGKILAFSNQVICHVRNYGDV